jgi:hypothetical protein
MTRPIQIRKDDVARDIRELAALRGVGITDVVGQAVRAELEKERRRGSPEDRERAIDRILAQVRALPRTGRTLTDDDLYDEYGLPK